MISAVGPPFKLLLRRLMRTEQQEILGAVEEASPEHQESCPAGLSFAVALYRP